MKHHLYSNQILSSGLNDDNSVFPEVKIHLYKSCGDLSRKETGGTGNRGTGRS